MVRFARYAVSGALVGALVSSSLPVTALAQGAGDGALPDAPAGELAETQPSDADEPAAPADEPKAEPVAPVSIAKAKISGVKKSYAYNGKKRTPKPKVTLAGTTLKAGRDYTLAYSANRMPGTAKLVVKGKGAYKGTRTRKFKIALKSTKLKKVKATGGALAVTWKKVSKRATGYQLRYAAGKSMKGAKTIRAKGKTKKRAVIRGLKGGKTYYVQVRTYLKKGGKTYRSAWSAKKRVKLARLTRKKLIALAGKATNSATPKTFNSSYVLSKTKAGRKLLSYMKVLRRSGKRLHVVMLDLSTGEGLGCGARSYVYSASCLKGPFVASLNKWKPASRRSSGLMRSTITVSNNNAYAALRNAYGSSTMAKMMRYSGVRSFNAAIKYTWLPARDLARLWVGTYWYFYKDTNANSAWCRSLYTHGTESFITYGMKTRGVKVNAKPGWFPGGGKDVLNDSGIVLRKVGKASRPYVLTVMTQPFGNRAGLRKLVRLIDDVHTDMVKSGYTVG